MLKPILIAANKAKIAIIIFKILPSSCSAKIAPNRAPKITPNATGFKIL